MKVYLEKVEKSEEEKIMIHCYQVTQGINEIVDFIKTRDIKIDGYKDSTRYNIFLYKIYYVESVDNKVFAYLEEDVYELKCKLYEFEASYEARKFFRCSKSVIVNLNKIESIKPALSGRFSAKLYNREEVIISRQYVPELRVKLKGDKL